MTTQHLNDSSRAPARRLRSVGQATAARQSLEVVAYPQATVDHTDRSIVLDLISISAGTATFAAELGPSASIEEQTRLYQLLSRFAAEAAMQSVLRPEQVTKPLAFRFTRINAATSPMGDSLTAQSDLVSRTAVVLRATGEVWDSAGTVRARGSLVATLAEVPSRLQAVAR